MKVNINGFCIVYKSNDESSVYLTLLDKKDLSTLIMYYLSGYARRHVENLAEDLIYIFKFIYWSQIKSIKQYESNMYI